MPRTALTIQSSSRDGLTVTYAAGDSANGHEVDNTTQNVMIHVKNEGVSSVDLTFITPKQVDGQSIGDRVVAVGAGVEMFIGPFNNDDYGSGTNFKTLYFDLSDDTSVTLAAIRVGPT